MGISIISCSSYSIHSFFLLVLLSSSSSFGATTTTSSTSYNHEHEGFLQCLSANYSNEIPVQVPIYAPKNSSYSTIFQSYARNQRFLSPNSTKPLYIITATHERHVQAAVICCRRHGLDLKVRSGGHDAEGLSYVSDSTLLFVLLDLGNLRNVKINVEDSTAWIDAGVTLGEFYYKIAEKSKTLGFPAGFCPTVGAGGHLSGGGLGALLRKYGAAADQVIDARIVNVHGEILDKQTMGKDLYWAIRGGGGSNFGVILSWKVKLVAVPPILTVATIHRTLQLGATDLVHKWQFIADRLPKEVYMSITFTVVSCTANKSGKNQNQKKMMKTVNAQFTVSFLGRVYKLLQLMDENFPELGLKRDDCNEISWIDSTIYLYAPGQPLGYLLDRDLVNKHKHFLKAKSDYVKEPISKGALEGIWKRFMKGEVTSMARFIEDEETSMTWVPLGGRMNEISESETPYPHRVGNIYIIFYVATWQEEKDTKKKVDWIRKLYRYMTPYVSKNPRSSYLNVNDLDLGQYNNGEVNNYTKAKRWGSKYFKGNFGRLVKVKSMVDPGNFFKNKQSIPPYLK